MANESPAVPGIHQSQIHNTGDTYIDDRVQQGFDRYGKSRHEVLADIVRDGGRLSAADRALMAEQYDLQRRGGLDRLRGIQSGDESMARWKMAQAMSSANRAQLEGGRSPLGARAAMMSRANDQSGISMGAGLDRAREEAAAREQLQRAHSRRSGYELGMQALDTDAYNAERQLAWQRKMARDARMAADDAKASQAMMGAAQGAIGFGANVYGGYQHAEAERRDRERQMLEDAKARGAAAGQGNGGGNGSWY